MACGAQFAAMDSRVSMLQLLVVSSASPDSVSSKYNSSVYLWPLTKSKDRLYCESIFKTILRFSLLHINKNYFLYRILPVEKQQLSTRNWYHSHQQFAVHWHGRWHSVLSLQH